MFDDNARLNAFSELVFGVFRLNGRITEWGDQFCAPLGLSTTRWQILGAIELARRPLTAPQIAYAMGLSRQAAQQQLNALLALGHVEKQANPLHERSHLYDITAQGKNLTAQAKALYAEYLNQAAAGLSDEQLALAQTLLASLSRNIEGIIRKENGKTDKGNIRMKPD